MPPFLDCYVLVESRSRDLVHRFLDEFLPHRREMTESDGPFVQIDGRPVLPWELDSVVDELARVWRVSREQAVSVVEVNFRRLCG
jgi:TatD DNase family protein